MLLLLTQMVVFGEIHCFFNAAEYAYLGKQSLTPPTTPKFQEVLLSKTNSTHTGKKCARCSCFQHR
jgi:hypothetical protein